MAGIPLSAVLNMHCIGLCHALDSPEALLAIVRYTSALTPDLKPGGPCHVLMVVIPASFSLQGNHALFFNQQDSTSSASKAVALFPHGCG